MLITTQEFYAEEERKGLLGVRQLCAILRRGENGLLGKGVLTLRVKHILSFPGPAGKTRHALEAELASVGEEPPDNTTFSLPCNLRLVIAPKGFYLVYA